MAAPAFTLARPTHLRAAVACPESFRLNANRTMIERTITLRDGWSSTTRTPLETSPRARNPTEDQLAAAADAIFLRSPEWPTLEAGNRSLRLVDLFSGGGLMTLGIWEACRALGRQLEPILAVDTNPFAARVYERNFPGARVSTARVEALLDGRLGQPPTAAERALIQWLGPIDITVSGPPCQGHSDLNNRTRRLDPRNRLYARMARFAEIVRPLHLLIENVGAVQHDRGHVVDRTLAVLDRLGYHVAQGLAEVSALGVPQRRRRHIVVASLHRPPCLERLALYARGERSVGWAIGDLRKLEGRTALDTPSRSSAISQRRMRYLFRMGRYDLPDHMRPNCHRLKDHSYKSVYGRLHWDEPAQTITSGFTCMGQGRYVHPKAPRTITPHEAARLQFIPDFFQFGDVPRTALNEMIANAVPPKLTYVLALELLR
jgi:DNA (cytosine-5)-methyltransferase 1